ncbi:RNA polymerase sigma factor SigF [Streptomyces sp. NPDC091273]|uniref:RNA polymerase sigma factor SigF n=1 Tax=Streptomyces sp. NPDC091273 TaxID=3365982 RepID=UPI002884087D|nr:RNA polymerase sigma factor SigF [Streptomyces sp. DSM 41633]
MTPNTKTSNTSNTSNTPRTSYADGRAPVDPLAEPLKASTADARSLSVVLFRRLSTLTEGTAEYSYVRNTLIELNLSLVKFAARRFRGRSEPMEDIVQVGTVGLIKAINRYDVTRGVEFTSFALPTITGEIKRFFRDTSWAVKVPRRLQELRQSLARASDELEQVMGRLPTEAELAAHLGITDAELAEGRQAAQAYSSRSLDVCVQEDADPGTAQRALGREEPAYERIEDLEALKPLLERLPARDREILSLRFGQEMTQSEIGEQLGISQMHVSRLLNRTLQNLRSGLLTDAPPSDQSASEPTDESSPDAPDAPDPRGSGARCVRRATATHG